MIKGWFDKFLWKLKRFEINKGEVFKMPKNALIVMEGVDDRRLKEIAKTVERYYKRKGLEGAVMFSSTSCKVYDLGKKK